MASNEEEDKNENSLPLLTRVGLGLLCLTYLIGIVSYAPLFLHDSQDYLKLFKTGTGDDFYRGLTNFGLASAIVCAFVPISFAALIGLFYFLFGPLIELPDEQIMKNYRSRASKFVNVFGWAWFGLIVIFGLCAAYGLFGGIITQGHPWFLAIFAVPLIIMLFRDGIPSLRTLRNMLKGRLDL